MSDTDKFWVIYRLNASGTSNKFSTKEEALAEAKRLAENNVGIKYYVFESVAIRETEKPQVVVTELTSRTPDVVRCGECRHWNIEKGDKYEDVIIGICERLEGYRTEEFYCAHGQRGVEVNNGIRVRDIRRLRL